MNCLSYQPFMHEINSYDYKQCSGKDLWNIQSVLYGQQHNNQLTQRNYYAPDSSLDPPTMLLYRLTEYVTAGETAEEPAANIRHPQG
jgi:hypothetical protein